MRILASNTLIASDQLAVGRVGPFGMAFNGEPIFDLASFYGAAYTQVYTRGDGPVECTFRVNALFASHALALHFCATHREALPVECDLQLIDDDADINLVLADAARQVSFGAIVGCAVEVAYRFIGSRFTSEAIPVDVEEDLDVMKLGKETPAADAEEISVVFGTPFASEPRFVNMNVERPTGQIPVAVIGYRDVTAAGFTAILSYPLPASGYFGRWQAVL